MHLLNCHAAMMHLKYRMSLRDCTSLLVSTCSCVYQCMHAVSPKEMPFNRAATLWRTCHGGVDIPLRYSLDNSLTSGLQWSSSSVQGLMRLCCYLEMRGGHESRATPKATTYLQNCKKLSVRAERCVYLALCAELISLTNLTGLHQLRKQR